MASKSSTDRMKRRTLLQAVAGVLAWPFARPVLARTAWQVSPELAANQIAAVEALAEAALPSALGDDGRRAVVERFAAWLREYREGADMGHGYGNGNLRRPSGPSPALQYPPQFAALDAAARAAGAGSFATWPVGERRDHVRRVLDGPPPVNRLPSAPTGEHLVADFLGFYFNSPDAWDLCYDAEIGSDRCRGLLDSDRRPTPGRGR
jgi:hypothetical protein